LTTYSWHDKLLDKSNKTKPLKQKKDIHALTESSGSWDPSRNAVCV